MKNTILILLALPFFFFSCASNKSMKKVVNNSLDFAQKQSMLMADTLLPQKGMLPRTYQNGKLFTSNSRWWCSGFFPGTLWYLYENSNDNKLKDLASTFTSRVEREKFTTDNHDVGFMIYCSFGNGLRLTNNDAYKEVLMTAAKSLSTRFDDRIGAIRSWNSNPKKWQYAVIVDNMMNLELLMWAYKYSGDKKFKDIAVSHADKTLNNHFRDDYSSYHVVSYDTITGNPHIKQTHQGYKDESAWARGQAWALYGYTMMYRETKDDKYLNQAENIAKFILNHKNMPEDGVPYWDFDVNPSQNEPRDASSAAIMASAFIELSQYCEKPLSKKCLKMAEKQLKSLSSDKYMAHLGENGDFILMHSTGSKPGNSEVDVPLSYADYYFVEALTRYKNLKKW
ncbi:MAG: glycoside hydrolase family 88 protein [Bacteroidales bacterium]|nr:glycoside hydrolase family 88 protein [Bacteroidales bacterium]